MTRELSSDLPPDLASLATEFGLDVDTLKKYALSEAWLSLRRIKQNEFEKEVVRYDKKEIQKQAKDLTSVRINLFNADIELVQTQFQKLVKYIDDKLEAGEVGVKEALTYLKLIMEKSTEIQGVIDRKALQVKDTDASIDKLLENFNTKTKLLTIIENNPPDPYREEREIIFAEDN